MASGEFWIVAGINGSGKTTIVSRKDIRRELGDLKVLNPDALAQKLRQDRPEMTEDAANRAAVTETEKEVARCIAAGESVLIETVLSTLKYEKHVLRARELGRYVGMIYIALRSVEQAVERVRNRKKLGGHEVPEAKIRTRWKRTIWLASRLWSTDYWSSVTPPMTATLF
jgi:predicted ABC-type ATPase